MNGWMLVRQGCRVLRIEQLDRCGDSPILERICDAVRHWPPKMGWSPAVLLVSPHGVEKFGRVELAEPDLKIAARSEVARRIEEQNANEALIDLPAAV